MSRRMDAPDNFKCPHRHSCPHLDTLSTTWVMEVYQESFKLREQFHAMEASYQQRIAELEKTLLERDQIGSGATGGAGGNVIGTGTGGLGAAATAQATATSTNGPT